MNRQGDSNPTLRQQPIRLLPLGLKTVASHTITYLLMGSLAFHFLHYDQIYGQPGSGLRAINDPLLILGAPLQVFRGILFASSSTRCARCFLEGVTVGC